MLPLAAAAELQKWGVSYGYDVRDVYVPELRYRLNQINTHSLSWRITQNHQINHLFRSEIPQEQDYTKAGEYGVYEGYGLSYFLRTYGRWTYRFKPYVSFGGTYRSARYHNRINLEDQSSIAEIKTGGFGPAFRFGADVRLSTFLLNVHYEQEYLFEHRQTASWGIDVGLFF